MHNKNFSKRIFFFNRENEDDLPTEIGRGLSPNLEDEETRFGNNRAGGGGYSRDEDEFRPTELASRTFMDRMDETLLDIPETGTLGLLWVVEGDRIGRTYKLHDGDIVGRRDGALILDDPKVSTPHCRFRLEDEGFVLWDCGSKNGTFVNNKVIRCATILEENDRIRIGDTVFTLKVLK